LSRPRRMAWVFNSDRFFICVKISLGNQCFVGAVTNALSVARGVVTWVCWMIGESAELGGLSPPKKRMASGMSGISTAVRNCGLISQQERRRFRAHHRLVRILSARKSTATTTQVNAGESKSHGEDSSKSAIVLRFPHRQPTSLLPFIEVTWTRNSSDLPRIGVRRRSCVGSPASTAVLFEVTGLGAESGETPRAKASDSETSASFSLLRGGKSLRRVFFILNLTVIL